MREILFRGQRTDNVEWVKGSLLLSASGKPYIRYYPDGGSKTSLQTAVIPETMGQYTGLTDKNGKKIFEGDIVEAQFSSNHSIQAFVVVYQEGHFAFNNSCIAVPRWEIYNLRIIGNIYENGELWGASDDK